MKNSFVGLERSIYRRNQSGLDLSGFSSRLLDIVRSRSLHPPNPILTSLNDDATSRRLPAFSRMLP